MTRVGLWDQPVILKAVWDVTPDNPVRPIMPLKKETETSDQVKDNVRLSKPEIRDVRWYHP